jgi:hypothetical protein
VKYFISLKTVYSFLGTLMFICAVLLLLDSFGVYDRSDVMNITDGVLIVIGFIGRGLIRKHEGREA